MKRTLIKNATIVNEGKSFIGSVLIEDDKISRIFQKNEESSESCHEVIDGTGKYLLPGVIDDHVHFRDPGLTHKADIQSESRAAAAGGVTSFMDMPNTQPLTTTLNALEQKFELGAQNSLVNYSFYFGATNGNAHLLSQLDRYRVCGVKLFMGSSTGNMLVDRMNSLLEIFNGTDLLIAAHCESQDVIKKNTLKYKARYGEDPDVRFHPFIRNVEACYHSSALAVKLARQTGARLHILHISTAKELSLFENKSLKEKKITAEVCIPHLLFTLNEYRTLGTRVKCNPAVKNVINREALREAVRSDLIDVIATDHAPHLLSEKQGGCMKAVSGMPMIQFSLVSMLGLVKEDVFSIEQVVQKMCHAPAELYQIHNRGYIKEGYQADLVLVNPTEWTLSSTDILSKCGWSPLEGYSFPARVEKTFVNGHLVYDNGIADESYRGQELRFR